MNNNLETTEIAREKNQERADYLKNFRKWEKIYYGLLKERRNRTSKGFVGYKDITERKKKLNELTYLLINSNYYQNELAQGDCVGVKRLYAYSLSLNPIGLIKNERDRLQENVNSEKMVSDKKSIHGKQLREFLELQVANEMIEALKMLGKE